MFEIGKEYWLELRIRGDKTHNMRGKVIEENNYMVKLEVVRNSVATEEIVPFARIINVNNVRDELKKDT